MQFQPSLTPARFLRWSLLAVALLMPWTASAGDPAFGYGITQQVLVGDPVVVSFQSMVALDSVSITVTRRTDKKTWEFSARGMTPGETREFTWEQKEGTYAYKMDVSAQGADGGDYGGTTTFEVTAFTGLEIDLDYRQSSMVTGDLVLKANRPVARVELDAFGDNRELIDSVSTDVGGSRDVHVHWETEGKQTVYARLQIYDDAETWAAVSVFSFTVPHDDVVFDSNESGIREDQVHKLEATLAIIEKAMRDYEEVGIELYVAGYTDSVGSAADNNKLSEKRAKSIAKWFRKRLSIPIFYQGFGEQVLAVPTPDNTDEERNRRAVYLLSNSTPGASVNYPRTSWRKVK